MACGCRGSRTPPAGGETIGYSVTYPDGTSTPDDQPFLSVVEAKAEIRAAGGGTIRRLVRKSSEG